MWLRDILVTAGIVVCLGLILVSGVLNFRFAYRLADTDFDGWLYGGGVCCAEIVKAMCPFAIAWGWRGKDPTAVLMGCVFFIGATVFSLTSATGYAAQHRAARSLDQSRTTEGASDLRRAYTRAEARVQALGPQRSPAEVERAIQTIMARPLGQAARTVGQTSQNCTLNRIDTRSHCLEAATLAEELERAREVMRLEAEMAEIRERLKSPATTTSAKAQVDVLEQITVSLNHAVSRNMIEAALAVGFALLIELGSGMGLYLVTTPWRVAEKGAKTKIRFKWKRVKGLPMDITATRIGYVDSFMYKCLDEKVGAELTMGELYLAYIGWCVSDGSVALSQKAFATEFASIAAQCGIPFRGTKRGGIFRDVMLVASTPALPPQSTRR